MPTRSGLCSILVDGNRPKLIVTVAVFAMALSSDSTVAQDKVAQPDIDKQVSELLTKLELLQQTDQSGEDEWARTIRDLIKLGPDAVPSLSQALRDTPYENRRMLRSIPFVLRGIGDARAVPALIESLIKCYGQDGSDMGYNTADPELLAFMRNHDDDLTDLDPNGYNWGRPINEVRTALQVLTGKEFNTSELCHIHGDKGSPMQQYLKQELFVRCAQRWASWWNDEGHTRVTDERYASVVVADLPAGTELPQLDPQLPLSVDARMSNMLCESMFTVSADQARVLYDIDTGRWGGIDSRFVENTTKNATIIKKWAASEGFDLIGSQVEVDGRTVFILELLDGQAWEIPFFHWTDYHPTSAETLMKQGQSVEQKLVVRNANPQPDPDANANLFDYEGTGLFLVITRHGTPAFVRLGIQVHDTNMKIGVPVQGDNELNPKAFRKGRRFAIRLLKTE